MPTNRRSFLGAAGIVGLGAAGVTLRSGSSRRPGESNWDRHLFVAQLRPREGDRHDEDSANAVDQHQGGPPGSKEHEGGSTGTPRSTYLSTRFRPAPRNSPTRLQDHERREWT